MTAHVLQTKTRNTRSGFLGCITARPSIIGSSNKILSWSLVLFPLIKCLYMVFLVLYSEPLAYTIETHNTCKYSYMLLCWHIYRFFFVTCTYSHSTHNVAEIVTKISWTSRTTRYSNHRDIGYIYNTFGPTCTEATNRIISSENTCNIQ